MQCRSLTSQKILLKLALTNCFTCLQAPERKTKTMKLGPVMSQLSVENTADTPKQLKQAARSVTAPSQENLPQLLGPPHLHACSRNLTRQAILDLASSMVQSTAQRQWLPNTIVKNKSKLMHRPQSQTRRCMCPVQYDNLPQQIGEL